jgi:hypothetical protein
MRSETSELTNIKPFHLLNSSETLVLADCAFLEWISLKFSFSWERISATRLVTIAVVQNTKKATVFPVPVFAFVRTSLLAHNIFVEYYLQGFPRNWHGNTQQRKIVCIIADLAELLAELPPGPGSTFHTQHP